ncbi:AsmA family protein [Gloeobacter morelensis]|uniref:AsmA family protein n=1 Tax=Gloeobacter morelensis MG652769 TaxID=2781736 RepID=A0ABY3PH57_9CYAN|nr:AsmA family protein [Gloeobacter morelensis]UFP92919.1 AsmA family protein [Gloeobacter morelensis MG652769]
MSEAVPAPGKSSPPPPRFALPLWLQRTLIGAAGVGLASFAGLALVPLFVDGESFRKPLQEALSRSLGRDVLLGRVELRTLGGIGLRTEQVRVVNREGTSELQARGAFVELALLPLLVRQIEVRNIEIDGAEIYLKRFRDGRWNVADLGDGQGAGEGPVNLAGTGLTLFDSTVRFDDEGVQPPQRFLASALSLKIQKFDRAELPINLQGRIVNALRDKPVATALTLDGTLAWPEDGDWQKLTGNLRILAEKFRPRYLSAYTRDIPSLAGLTGVFDLDFVWKGALGGESRLEGTCNTRLLRWDWPLLFGGQPWLARKVKVDTAMGVSSAGVRAERLRLSGEGFDADIQGSVRRPTGESPSPLLDLTVKTGFIDPFAVRTNAPLQLVAEPWREWIATSKGSGRLRTELVVRGPLDTATTGGSFEFQNFKLSNPRLRSPVDALNGRLVLSEAALALEDLRVGAPGQQTTFTGTIARRPEGPIDLKAVGTGGDLSIFSNLGGGRLGLLSGRGDVDLTFTGTLDAPQILGRAELVGASLLREGWVQPLKNLRGEVVFEATKITLANLEADLGNSSLSVDGVLEGYGSAAPNPQLTISSSGLDLKAAYPILVSDLFEGGFRRALRSTFRGLAGNAGVELKVDGTLATGTIDLRGATLALVGLAAPLEEAVGTVALGERGTTIEQLRAVAAGSPVNLKGTVGRDGEMQLSGNGTLNFPRALSLVPAGSRDGVRATGSAPLSFTLTGGPQARALQLSADLTAVSELTLGNLLRLAPARRLVLVSTLTPRSLLVGEASRLEGERTLNLAGSLGNLDAKSQRYDLRVRSDAPMTMAELGRYVVPFANLGATAGSIGSFDLALVGPVSAPGLRGNLELAGVNLPNLLGGIEDLSGPLNFDGNRVSTPGMNFRLGSAATGRIGGSLTDFRDPRLDFEARFDRLDLDELVASSAATEGESLLKGLRGEGTVQIDRGLLSRLTFADLSARARLERGLWNLSQMSLAAAGGRMTGTLGADVRSTIPQFSGDLAFRGTDINLLATVLLGLGDQIFGEGDLQVKFQSQGANPDAFLGALSGNGTLLVQNGRLAANDLLGPLFGAAGGNFAGAAGAVRALTTGRFDRLEGSFNLAGGTATTENMVYLSSGIQLRPVGSLVLLDRTANLQVQGEFERTNGQNPPRRPGGGNGRSLFAFEVAGPINQTGSLRDLRWVDEPVPIEERPASTP